MFLSTLLQKNGVKITPEIKALIKKFGDRKFRDRWIPKQFQNDFVKRIQLLDEPILFGYKPHELDLLFSNMFSLDKIYSYRGSEFMEKFPKFEILFVKIWCLIHTRNPEYHRRDDLVEYSYSSNLYFYLRNTVNEIVKVFIKDDSVEIVIEDWTLNTEKVKITIC